MEGRTLNGRKDRVEESSEKYREFDPDVDTHTRDKMLKIKGEELELMRRDIEQKMKEQLFKGLEDFDLNFEPTAFLSDSEKQDLNREMALLMEQFD